MQNTKKHTAVVVFNINEFPFTVVLQVDVEILETGI